MADAGGMGAIWRTIGIPNYRNYMVGNFFSQLGMWVLRISVGWLTWELTKSPTWLGIIAFVDFFPNMVFAPLAGALADRLDRLRAIQLYVSLSSILAAAIAGLTLSGLITIESLVVLVMLKGIVMAFNYPARLSVLHSLVDRESLTTAISINAVAFNIARIGGPALAGFIIVHVSVGASMAFTAVADIVFVVSLIFVKLRRTETVRQKKSPREIPAEIMEGFRYAARHPGIGPLLVILGMTSIFSRPFVDLFPGFADEIFGRGADGLALLTSMLGVGAFVGSVVLARFQGVVGLTRMMIMNVLLLSVAVIGFTATDIFWVALCFTALGGFAMVAIGVIEQTLLQASVDGSMRGRVLSLYTLIARGCPSLGALLMGWLASHFGLQLPVAGGALLCVGLWYWARRRQDTLAASLEVKPDEVS